MGPTISRRLLRLGLKTIRDLLFHFPFRYDDFRNVTTVAKLVPDATATIRGRLSIIENHRSPRKRLLLTEALLSDATGTIKAVWFNQPWLTKLLKPGDILFLSGTVERTAYGVEFVGPAFEKASSDPTHTARLVPVYPTTDNLTAKQIRFLVRSVLPLASTVPDPLPLTVRQREGLVGVGTAIREVHFPTSDAALERARARLAFDELLRLQLRASVSRRRREALPAPSIAFDEPLVRSFVQSLPFRLTDAQRRSAWDILNDLERSRPMNRLLQGDVGSGKTVVATIAMLNAARRGFQCAFMAPTEILAQQHDRTIRKLFASLPAPPPVALITGSRCTLDGDDRPRKELLTMLFDGDVPIVIGTHALIEKNVSFGNLGLVVVDEQHRFGVEQRFRLWKNKSLATRPSQLAREEASAARSEQRDVSSVPVPHFLSMSATPIPRSLAHAVYADLDLSVLDELPKGRRPIETVIVPMEQREGTYDRIRREVRNGQQGFIICPLIDPSDVFGVRSATAEFDRLRRDVFPDLRLGLLHGRLAAKKKEVVMADVLNRRTDLLVSTAVVEVGVDVPSATVMVIEGAERFGLAQLHQFRGRIGRGDQPSTCFLFSDSEDPRALKRLRSLVQSRDGFALAEEDLQLRGAGELFGVRQSGFPELTFANLTDHSLLRRCRRVAEEILNADPHLQHSPLLKTWIESETINHPE